MKDFFLLGAGASVEAGIPDSYGMTNRMLDAFSIEPKLLRFNKAIRFVVGGLLFQQGIKGENPYDGISIEDLFNAMQLLRERRNSELNPFVGSWHPLINEIEGSDVSLITASQLLETIFELQSGIRFNYARLDFQKYLTIAMREFAAGSGGVLFTDVGNKMIQTLINMAWVKDVSNIKYLVPLVRYAKKKKAIFATLNYDNALELAAQSIGIRIDTGFEAWSKTGDFEFNNRKLPLIKLHGSIDWALSVEHIPDKPLAYEKIEQIKSIEEIANKVQPAIIFGGKNKLTAKGPFLSLLRIFQTRLSECDRLILIGYSFRDDHVNEYLRSWINGNPKRLLVIINPHLEKIRSPFYDELQNIGDKTRLVTMVMKASHGILKFVGEKERE